jgi:hypothetical protein
LLLYLSKRRCSLTSSIVIIMLLFAKGEGIEPP